MGLHSRLRIQNGVGHWLLIRAVNGRSWLRKLPVKIELDSAKIPYADALEVIEFEKPYLLQFQVMGIAECSCAAG